MRYPHLWKTETAFWYFRKEAEPMVTSVLKEVPPIWLHVWTWILFRHSFTARNLNISAAVSWTSWLRSMFLISTLKGIGRLRFPIWCRKIICLPPYGQDIWTGILKKCTERKFPNWNQPVMKVWPASDIKPYSIMKTKAFTCSPAADGDCFSCLRIFFRLNIWLRHAFRVLMFHKFWWTVR